MTKAPRIDRYNEHVRRGYRATACRGQLVTPAGRGRHTRIGTLSRAFFLAAPRLTIRRQTPTLLGAVGAEINGTTVPPTNA